MAERSMALRSGNWYSPRGATTNPLRSLERGVGSNPTLFSYDQLWSLVGYGVAVRSMTLTHQPGVRLPVSEIFLRPMPRIIACLGQTLKRELGTYLSPFLSNTLLTTAGPRDTTHGSASRPTISTCKLNTTSEFCPYDSNQARTANLQRVGLT
jgi:hypothetical protein